MSKDCISDLSKPTRLSGSLTFGRRSSFNRVLVCGGRNYADDRAVYDALDRLHREAQANCMVVIQGGATGADQLARQWCQSRFVMFEHYPANWREHGKAAGPIRNTRMLTVGRPDVVIAFPGGHGTADMVRKAGVVGVPVIRVPGGVGQSKTEAGPSDDSHEQADPAQRSAISPSPPPPTIRPDTGDA